MLDSISEHTNTLKPHSSIERSQDGEKANNLNDDDGIQFRPSRLNESGVSSPPLWSKSPVGSKLSQNKIRNSPPSLRVQAIARGQKELMDMVKRMPESSYELSLKDLVDHQKQEDVVDQEKTRKIARTGSNMSESNNNTGLFLKMVFPMPFGASKKQKGKAKTKENPYDNKNNLNDKSSNKKQWWQRRYSDDSESGGLSSIGSSDSSGSSGSNHSTISNNRTRKKGGLLRGCCSPFDSKTNNTAE